MTKTIKTLQSEEEVIGKLTTELTNAITPVTITWPSFKVSRENKIKPIGKIYHNMNKKTETRNKCKNMGNIQLQRQ